MTAQAGTEAARTPVFSFAAFAAVADRLEQVLDRETEALERHRPCDLAAACHGKRQGLLELSRFLPRAATQTDQQAARRRLDGLSAKLERNSRALDIQIGAVREVADIIARAIRDADSDGTYSLQANRR